MKELMELRGMKPGVPAMLVATLGALQARVLELGKLDRRYEGKLTGGGRCVWLTDGRRVEFEAIGDGGFIGALSKEPDPAYPGRGS